MIKFKGEDLIVINIERIRTEGSVRIENTRINRFRNGLRVNGIINDLGAREFETLRFSYPHNIIIESQSITIKGTENFVRTFERRRLELQNRLQSVTVIWEESE